MIKQEYIAKMWYEIMKLAVNSSSLMLRYFNFEPSFKLLLS